MKLNKTCGCCKIELTTKNTINIGRNEIGLWYNCLCGSTGLLTPKLVHQVRYMHSDTGKTYTFKTKDLVQAQNLFAMYPDAVLIEQTRDFNTLTHVKG